MKRLTSLLFASLIFFSMTVTNVHSKQSGVGRYSMYNSHNGINRVTSQDSSLTLVGRWPYGPCDAVFVKDDYAYIGNGSVMTILDISNPSSPKKVGEIETPGIVKDIYVRGHYAYVANGREGLRVINVSDPSRSVEVGRYTSGGYTSKVYVHRQLACINIGLDISILNVSAPSGPELRRRINLSENVSDIEIKNIGEKIYLFVANHTGGFRLYDITDSENPVEVDSIEDINPVYNVTISGDYAYVVGYSYLYIIDVKNPEDIELKSAFYCSHGMEEVYVSGDYAYITDIYYGGLWIIDVSEPDNPSFAAYFIGDISDAVWDVQVKDRHVYMACSSDGLHVLEVSVPENPVAVSSFDTRFFCGNLVVVNSHAYVSGGSRLHIYDVTNPENPKALGYTESYGSLATDIEVIGDYAYFLSSDGLRIINVNDPNHPSLNGVHPTQKFASAVSVKEDYAYLSCWDGLHIIDVSDKSNPTEAAFIETEDRGIDIEISQNRAFMIGVGYDPHHLHIFNISTPDDPVLIRSFYIPGFWMNDVYVYGMLAYVASSSTGFRILDVRSSDNPVEIGAYIEKFAWTSSISVKNNFAYMATGLSGLRIIDVSRLESPSEISHFRTDAYGLFVQGNLVYVTAGDGGFYILKNELTDETEYIPSHITVIQNYPNPFNVSTAIRFALSVPSHVTLKMFDLKGRELETLVDDELYNTGIHEVEWTADNLPSGVYVCQFHAGGNVETKKMILIR